MMRCAVCQADAATAYRNVDGVAYFRCRACGSLFAHPDFLARVEAGGSVACADEYWRSELSAARERCFGPAVLRSLVGQLAGVFRRGSLYLFNSGQPEFVEREDPGYLDPHGRGHVVSYSLAGAAAIFGPAGFNVIALPGRAWAFLAEFGPQHPVDAEALISRLWHPVPENVAMLRSARFGELMRAAGIEAARAYLPGR